MQVWFKTIKSLNPFISAILIHNYCCPRNSLVLSCLCSTHWNSCYRFQLKWACSKSCLKNCKWRESVCWLAQTNDIHGSHFSLWSVLWTVTLDGSGRIMCMAAWILETDHKFNLSITVRRWVIISTCQVGPLLQMESDSTLLPFCCILKCKWLLFSQSRCAIESFYGM